MTKEQSKQQHKAAHKKKYRKGKQLRTTNKIIAYKVRNAYIQYIAGGWQGRTAFFIQSQANISKASQGNFLLLCEVMVSVLSKGHFFK